MNYTASRDSIYRTLTDAITANAAAIIGYVPDIRYRGKIRNPALNPDGFSLNVAALDVEANRKIGAYLYRTVGVVTVMLRCPASVPDCGYLGRQLAEVVQTAYRGRHENGALWYSKARIEELGNDGPFYVLRITADYGYTETNGS